MVTKLQEDLQGQKEEHKLNWRMFYQQSCEQEQLLAEKEMEIEQLKCKLACRSSLSHHDSDSDDSTVSSCSSMCGLMLQEPKKKNVVKLHLWTKKAEKIQKSTLMIGSQDFKELHAGMDGLMMRLPIQLAGHSRGKMLQEWNLLLEFDKATFQKAASAIRKAFGPGSKVLAAQDSRHTSQHEGKAASSFICRLERTLAIIYGEDHPNSETRTIFLYGRLQKGLHHDLMHSPSVLGALTFKEMVIVVKNKEKCQSELEKRQQNLDPAI